MYCTTNSEKPQITTITSFTLPDHILDSSLYVFPHFLTAHSEDSPFVRPHIDGKGETPNNSYSTNTEKRGNGMKRSDYDPRQVEWRNAPMQRSMSAAYLFYFVKKEKIRSVGGKMAGQQPIFSLYTFSFFFSWEMINSIPTPSRRPLSSNKYIQRIWLPEAAVWVYSWGINSCFYFLDSFLRSSREPFAAVCYSAIKSRFKRMAISINKRPRGYFLFLSIGKTAGKFPVRFLNIET